MADSVEPKDKTEPKRLSARSRAGLKWLHEYMSTPDDMGEEWWAEFNKELEANRFSLRRTDER